MKSRPLVVLQKADISIQGSSAHYSKPRVYLEDVEQYEAVEIALFNKDGSWINPHDSSILDAFPRLEELQEMYENNDVPVGCYIPLELVKDLISFLEEE